MPNYYKIGYMISCMMIDELIVFRALIAFFSDWYRLNEFCTKRNELKIC